VRERCSRATIAAMSSSVSDEMRERVGRVRVAAELGHQHVRRERPHERLDDRVERLEPDRT
jgi:hypothetical protein